MKTEALINYTFTTLNYAKIRNKYLLVFIGTFT